MSMDKRATEAEELLRGAMRAAADQLKRGEWNSHTSGTWQILNDALLAQRTEAAPINKVGAPIFVTSTEPQDDPTLPAAPDSGGMPEEQRFQIDGQWYYRGNRSPSWFATYREGFGLAEKIPREMWPVMEEVARLRAYALSLREKLREADKELKEAKRDAAAEASWKHKQGDEYGSY